LFLIPVASYGIRRLWLAFRDKTQSADVKSSDQNGSVMLGIWIIVIVAFFSISKSKEDLYILPIYPAAAALVGGLLARLIRNPADRPPSILRVTVLALAVCLGAAGSIILLFFGNGTQPYEIAGANLIGCAAIVGGLSAAIAAVLNRMPSAILATALGVAACNWVFVVRSLPDFERFKPVRTLCEIISSEAGPDALVGYYRTAYPSMVFYLRRPVFEYYHQPEIEAAFSSGKEVFCLMTETEFESLRMRVPVQT